MKYGKMEDVNDIQIGNKIKLFLLADNIIVHIEKLEVCIRKLLKLINEFCKILGCKANIQKSILFLYTGNERLKKEKKYHLK